MYEYKSLSALKQNYTWKTKKSSVGIDCLGLSCSLPLTHSQYTQKIFLSLCFSLRYTHTAYLSVAQSPASASPLIVWEQNNSPGFGNGLPLILIRETLNKIYPQILHYDWDWSGSNDPRGGARGKRMERIYIYVQCVYQNWGWRV